MVKQVIFCQCGSPRVFRDLTKNVNTGAITEAAGVSCEDCGYDGAHFYTVDVPDSFNVDRSNVTDSMQLHKKRWAP